MWRRYGSKYNSAKVYVYEDGFASRSKDETEHGVIKERFDSMREYGRYKELAMLEKGGYVKDLKRQVRYELVPTQRDSKGKALRSVYYVADFVYQDKRGIHVEDTKGFKTPEYEIKKKLMLFMHDIEIEEV